MSNQPNRRAQPPAVTRRGFLSRAAGVGAIALAATVTDCSGPTEKPWETSETGPWLFGRFTPASTGIDFDERQMQLVSLPHCVVDLPWWRWDPNTWSDLWIYRRHLLGRPPRGQRTWVRFGGVLSAAAVYLNGQRLGECVGGYLPFEYELTDRLRAGDNVLAVVVNSRWGLDAPPSRPHPWRARSVDFFQPGGLPRPAEVRRTPPVFTTRVFASPADVLDPQRRRVDVSGELDARRPTSSPVQVTARLRDGTRVLAETSARVPVNRPGSTPFSLSLRAPGEVQLWDVDAPKLYEVEVVATNPELVRGERYAHHERVRIGFREARWQRDGFYLNGRRLQLFGLNRHELHPFTGMAMPARVQRRDAELLKNELNCNMVRCSHYPQSEAFLDACDELGLLVWEEAPGWEYIGDKRWRDRVVGDVRDMVLRDRNRPSVVVWGTRLNETGNDVALYTRTHDTAKQLDPTRATSGAVNPSIVTRGHPIIPQKYRDPFEVHPGVQDIFAFNDYEKPRQNGLPHLQKPRTDLPYLVTEAVGVLAGHTHFRRTDATSVQARQAQFHASVHDDALSDPRYSGLLAWCAFDYPSADGVAKDGVKWAGVYDLFREPKLGAAFYRAQVSPQRKPVIAPAFHWDDRVRFGRGELIWSNCEELDVFLGGQHLARLSPQRGMFPHLPYPPFSVDFPPKPTRRGDLRIEGRVGGAVVLARSFSADRSKDRLQLGADDQELHADAVDATRLPVRVVDRFGATRPFQSGKVTFSVDGPGNLIGTNPLDLTGNGGTGAVWLRSTTRPGTVTVSAQHPGFPAALATVRTTRSQDDPDPIFDF